MMRRSSRVHLLHLNKSKIKRLYDFIARCHIFQQYFADLLWQQNGILKSYCDPVLLRRGSRRFRISYRLASLVANEVLGTVKSVRKKNRCSKPNIHKFSITLNCLFSVLEKSTRIGFDFVLKLKGCEIPVLNIPFSKTAHLNKFLNSGWQIAKSFHIGFDLKHRLYVDLILEKPRPKRLITGEIVGFDSNYKGGMVFSDGRIIGEKSYAKIRSFAKREKNTHGQIKQELNRELKQFDFSNIRQIAVEDLKYVKHFKRETFSRVFNRRLSHWTYRYFMTRLGQICEERGIFISKKYPGYTSQTCSRCHNCDKRNRVEDRFECTSCGFQSNADLNAAFNLKTLGEAEVYGLRSLKNWRYQKTLDTCDTDNRAAMKFTPADRKRILGISPVKDNGHEIPGVRPAGYCSQGQGEPQRRDDCSSVHPDFALSQQ